MSTAAVVVDVADDEASTWRAIVDRARAMLDACDPADPLGRAIMGDALARAQEIAAKAARSLPPCVQPVTRTARRCRHGWQPRRPTDRSRTDAHHELLQAR